MCPVEIFKNYLQVKSQNLHAKFFETVIDPIKVHKFDGVDLNFGQLEDR